MSFCMVLLMILLMMVNKMRKIQIKGSKKHEEVGSGANTMNKISIIRVCKDYLTETFSNSMAHMCWEIDAPAETTHNNMDKNQ